MPQICGFEASLLYFALPLVEGTIPNSQARNCTALVLLGRLIFD